MCIAPNVLPDGLQIACRECWQCREQAINDWVGRNIAESKTAKASHAITLTYGRDRLNDADHERARLLTYSDVQKYFKLLRRHGFPVRYFIAGEYGSAKGRAHWHGCVYWLGPVPSHELGRRFMEEHWPHGWSHWTTMQPAAVRYACKYVQKDMVDEDWQGKLVMSKKPVLGYDYVTQLAERYVEQGLSPQSLDYSFSEVRRKRKDGRQEVVPFRLKGRTAEIFVSHFIEKWREAHGQSHWPVSKLVDLFDEYGRIVSDENRLPAASRPLGKLEPGHARRWRFHDIGDWRRQFDKERNNVTEEQRSAEQRWREQQDDDDAERYEKRLRRVLKERD